MRAWLRAIVIIFFFCFDCVDRRTVLFINVYLCYNKQKTSPYTSKIWLGHIRMMTCRGVNWECIFGWCCCVCCGFIHHEIIWFCLLSILAKWCQKSSKNPTIYSVCVLINFNDFNFLIMDFFTWQNTSHHDRQSIIYSLVVCFNIISILFYSLHLIFLCVCVLQSIFWLNKYTLIQRY